MIAPIPAIPPAPALSPTAGATTTGAAASGASSTQPSQFSDLLGQAIDSLNNVNQQAQTLALQGATGQANVADVTVAATQAELDVSLVTTVRDKAVAAFNSIMSMPA